MLDKVTAETFKPLEQSEFSMAVDAQTKISLKLLSATEKPQRGFTTRTPFSLLFLSAEDVVRPQRMYPLTHEKLGTLEIFLVPIGRRDGGVLYEAVFT